MLTLFLLGFELAGFKRRRATVGHGMPRPCLSTRASNKCRKEPRHGQKTLAACKMFF